MGSRNRSPMCYKSRWGRGREKRRPSTLARGHGDGLQISSRAATILARRPTIRAICLQLKMTSRIFSTTAVGDFISAGYDRQIKKSKEDIKGDHQYPPRRGWRRLRSERGSVVIQLRW